jgi:hypothetical protein
MFAGTNSDRILEAAKLMVNIRKGWVNPFGNGTTSKMISSILMKNSFLGPLRISDEMFSN